MSPQPKSKENPNCRLLISGAPLIKITWARFIKRQIAFEFEDFGFELRNAQKVQRAFQVALFVHLAILKNGDFNQSSNANAIFFTGS